MNLLWEFMLSQCSSVGKCNQFCIVYRWVVIKKNLTVTFHSFLFFYWYVKRSQAELDYQKELVCNPSNPESLQCPPPWSSEPCCVFLYLLCTLQNHPPPAPTSSLCCGSRVAVEGPSWTHGWIASFMCSEENGNQFCWLFIIRRLLLKWKVVVEY